MTFVCMFIVSICKTLQLDLIERLQIQLRSNENTQQAACQLEKRRITKMDFLLISLF